MIVVTGAYGFIGSNLVRALTKRNNDDVVAVDSLADGRKCLNLVGATISDFIDKDEFLDWLVERGDTGIDAVFHLGACSDTTEWDGRFMMDVNFSYSKQLFELCQAYRIPFIYASSAAVYGASTSFREDIGTEEPLNLYGYSKALFDQYVWRARPRWRSQVVGLRYFNVYGPRESHKGRMASVALHNYEQFKAGEAMRLFAGCKGYGDGEQRRDFIHVDDAVAVNVWCKDNPHVNGIFNCGSGEAERFREIPETIMEYYGEGELTYMPFPPELVDNYQCWTRADLTKLRATGCELQFRSIREGVVDYLRYMDGLAT